MQARREKSLWLLRKLNRGPRVVRSESLLMGWTGVGVALYYAITADRERVVFRR